jgi:predicted metal-dependent hydrolase
VIASITPVHLNPSVQFLFSSTSITPPAPASIQVAEKAVPLLLVRNNRARRYVLRLRSDGTARITIPRGGSSEKARQFVGKNLEWLRQQMERLATRPVGKAAWRVGSDILFRGEAVRISALPDVTNGRGAVTFANHTIRVSHIDLDHRPQIERHLHRLAATELPPKVFHLAHQHGLKVERVSVRNQKSRWGSCSRRGTISLNWRLLQAPEFVADYIILHELMHIRQMNHSRKFWQEVEKVCPEYRVAERWLKAHGQLLR